MVRSFYCYLVSPDDQFSVSDDLDPDFGWYLFEYPPASGQSIQLRQSGRLAVIKAVSHYHMTIAVAPLAACSA